LARAYTIRRSMTCKPAAVGSNQTWQIPVKKGERVLWATMQRTISAGGTTDNTFQARVAAGGGGGAAGLLAATDPEGTVGTIVAGAGADLANSGGLLVTADSTIDILYTAGGIPGAIVPEARFVFGIVRDYPY
jgi:hypothetical protein